MTAQNILITGTSSGFGFLTAQTLLDKGHTIYAAMRGPGGRNAEAADKLKQIAAETDGRVLPLDLDVTDGASVEGAVSKALADAGRIDVVVNNAGYGVGGYAEAVTDDQFERQFDVNVFGVQRVMRAVLPAMRKQGSGLVINISSVMGRVVIPFAAVYTASKWALEGLSESYRYELSGTGVDVVLVEPGGFGTNFLANMVHGKDADRLESYGELAGLPEQMWGSFSKLLTAEGAPNPQDVADAVLGLVDTPAGQRPLRTVVDPMTGGAAPETMNKTSDQVQQLMFEGMELQNLLSVKP